MEIFLRAGADGGWLPQLGCESVSKGYLNGGRVSLDGSLLILAACAIASRGVGVMIDEGRRNTWRMRKASSCGLSTHNDESFGVDSDAGMSRGFPGTKKLVRNPRVPSLCRYRNEQVRCRLARKSGNGLHQVLRYAVGVSELPRSVTPLCRAWFTCLAQYPPAGLRVLITCRASASRLLLMHFVRTIGILLLDI